MNKEKQRIAIAEACGWKEIKSHWWSSESYGEGWDYSGRYDDGDEEGVPDYLNDLNAMHEAEKVIIEKDECIEYECILSFDFNEQPWHTTPAQRAEAFLRCLNLWIDE